MAGVYPLLKWDLFHQAVQRTEPVTLVGQVAGVVGLTVLCRGPAVSLGETCEIRTVFGRSVAAEVVGFREGQVLLMPVGEMDGISPGCEVVAQGGRPSVPVGWGILGRVVDGLGRPIDGHGPWGAETALPVHNQPPPAMERRVITEVLETGVRAIDTLLTCGKGQRMGIFAGSGVGKSTLLGMIARYTSADVSVVALVGERGREVREFIERDLGPSGLARSVVVVATSDQPAVVRLRAAMVATSIAEFFRDQGKDVVLIMDSVTRLCMAQREIGLAVGEPPATRGYPPSVFALLPRLLERSGTSARGSITGFYAVLVEGDDMNEPVTDAVRGILDGHVTLSRELAAQNQYPAIDVLQSVSRVMPALVEENHRRAAGEFRSLLASMREARDLIDIGAYQPGSNPQIDRARSLIDGLTAFLKQGVDDRSAFGESAQGLRQVVGLTA